MEVLGRTKFFLLTKDATFSSISISTINFFILLQCKSVLFETVAVDFISNKRRKVENIGLISPDVALE
jgi:hypothetical protein